VGQELQHNNGEAPEDDNHSAASCYQAPETHLNHLQESSVQTK
jgi:hypothetical protein